MNFRFLLQLAVVSLLFSIPSVSMSDYIEHGRPVGLTEDEVLAGPLAEA